MDLLSTLIALLGLVVLIAARMNPLRPLDDRLRIDEPAGRMHVRVE